ETILNRMLEPNPDRRYLNADQVISALLRSRLITGLPGYAQKGERSLDPLSKEVESLSQPTRPDLRLRPSGACKPTARWWSLRSRDENGKVHASKATTARVLKELSRGRLRQAVAARQMRGRFRPLTDYPEFHGVFATDPPSKPVPITPPPKRLSCWHRRLLTSLGFGLFALAGFASLYRIWHPS